MAWMIPIIVSEQEREDEDRLLAALIAQDHEGRYEFKVLRGGPGTFRKPERLQEVLDEEARAQWEMAMKLDNARIVLRRPRTARARDTLSGAEVNPYRTDINGRQRARAIFWLLIVGAIGAGLALLLVTGGGGASSDARLWPVIAVTLVAILVVTVVVVRIAGLRR